MFQLELNSGDYPEHREIEFPAAVTLFFKNYANFDGRSSRGACWWAFLFTWATDLFVGGFENAAGLFEPSVQAWKQLAFLIPG